MASKSENAHRHWLPTFIEDIKTYFSKIISGKVSAVSDLLVVTENIVSVMQSDADINLNQVAEIIDCLGNVVRCLLEQHDELQESHAELQVSIQDLDDKPKELEDLEETLLIGQIALKVEKVFVEEIMNGTNVTDLRYLTIYQLHSALSNLGRGLHQSKDILMSQEEVYKAKANWKTLDSTFELNSNFYHAITTLKSYRNSKAHPDMSVIQARERLSNCRYRNIVSKLLDILEKASIKNIGT